MDGEPETTTTTTTRVKTRRLPSWMSSSSACNSTTAAAPNRGGGTRKRTVKKLTPVEEEEDTSLELDLDEDGLLLHLPMPANKRRTSNRKQQQLPIPAAPPSHNSKPKRRRQSKKDDSNISLAGEEEEELSVDDLMSIAQEYVKADDRKEYQQGLTTEPESGRPLAATSLSYRNDSGGSTFNVEMLPARTSLDLLSNLNQTKPKDQEHSASKEIIHSSSRTGDPAQDMLDLFLGPLLKKPRVEETRCEAFTEEIALDLTLQKQSQKEELGKQVPTLVKKKSSLRDKVAMLLD